MIRQNDIFFLIVATIFLLGCIQPEKQKPTAVVAEVTSTPTIEAQPVISENAMQAPPDITPKPTRIIEGSPEPVILPSPRPTTTPEVPSPAPTPTLTPSPTVIPTPTPFFFPTPTQTITPSITPPQVLPSPTSTGLSPTPPPAPRYEMHCNATVCSTASCLVDFSTSSEASTLAGSIAQVCEESVIKIPEKIPNPNLKALRLIFRENQANPGETSGNTIHLKPSWFKAHPEDMGAVVHEIAHAFQAYPLNNPFWLVEGIADDVRYWMGYPTSWSYAHCGPGSEHYTSGYWCAAALLKYVERVYDANLIPKVDARLKQGNYSNGIFVTYTGKGLEVLWQECQQAECKPT